jgi:hypothetical protein
MSTIPVEALFNPCEVATTVPPVTLPVALTVPVEILFAPKALVPLPPITFPVRFKVPVELFLAATPKFPDPPVQFPVIVSVPELPTEAAAVACEEAWLVAEPVKLPTINPDAGEAAVNCRQAELAVVDLCETLAVKVMPSFRVKTPDPALETSSQVTFAVIVIVWPVEARASSPAPGTMPPTHVAPALKFPVAAERISAIFYSPFA